MQGSLLCIQNQTPGRDSNSQVWVNKELPDISKCTTRVHNDYKSKDKKEERAFFKQTAFVHFAATISQENLGIYGICLHLNKQPGIPSTKCFGDQFYSRHGKTGATLLWRSENIETISSSHFFWKVSNVEDSLFGGRWETNESQEHRRAGLHTSRNTWSQENSTAMFFLLNSNSALWIWAENRKESMRRAGIRPTVLICSL